MNPLEPVKKWYEVVNGNQRLIKMFLKKHPGLFPIESVLSSKTSDEARDILDKAKIELDDLTIVSLYSIFESKILSQISSIISTIATGPSTEFVKSIAKYTAKNSERWLINDILDLYKSKVNPDLVGNVKQIYNYRNWVAHGKKTGKPLALDPITVYERLFDFLDQAGLI